MLRNTLKPGEETNSTGNCFNNSQEENSLCKVWSSCMSRPSGPVPLKSFETGSNPYWKKKLLTNMHVKIFHNEVETSEITIVASVWGELLPSYNFFFFCIWFHLWLIFPKQAICCCRRPLTLLDSYWAVFLAVSQVNVIKPLFPSKNKNEIPFAVRFN